MRTEFEIRQALADLKEALPRNIVMEGINGPSVKFCKAMMDLLSWVLIEPSTADAALQALRQITAQRKAGSN